MICVTVTINTAKNKVDLHADNSPEMKSCLVVEKYFNELTPQVSFPCSGGTFKISMVQRRSWPCINAISQVSAATSHWHCPESKVISRSSLKRNSWSSRGLSKDKSNRVCGAFAFFSSCKSYWNPWATTSRTYNGGGTLISGLEGLYPWRSFDFGHKMLENGRYGCFEQDWRFSV